MRMNVALLFFLLVLTGFAAPLEGKAGRVLVVAHSGVLRAALVHLGDVPRDQFWKVPQPNCCVNVLVCENGAFRVKERAKSFAKTPDATTSSLAAP